MRYIEHFGSHFLGESHVVVAGLFPSSRKDRTLPTGRVNESVTTAAYVNHGRWVSRCPLCGGGCEFADLDAGLFFCCECRNEAVGHDYVRTVVPSVKERRQIENALLGRPEEKTRSWVVRETVADLVRENASHGVR